MPYDMSCQLWPNRDESFFQELKLQPVKQTGPHCVSTSLAILTRSTPEQFQGIVNTQDPVSWSNSLKEWGMKLAYCPTDVRKLQYYIPELIELDDLFTLSYYTTLDENTILGDPYHNGWICGSHIVVMHRDKILDPLRGTVTSASVHSCNEHHTKRVFRVVPVDYYRGL